MMVIGTHAEVVDATNPSIIGLNGTVLVETKSMLVINTKKGVRTLPKLHCMWNINGVTIPGKAIQGHIHQRLTWT